jgi:FkbM family methyltransferase
MRGIIASIVKLFFRLRFFRRRYYGIVFRIFQPRQLFNGVTRIAKYDGDLKMKLDLDEWVQQHIYFLDYFDPAGISLIKNRLRQGDVFIDIGANIGSYSLVAAKQVGDNGRVIAFEPVGTVFNRLRENIALSNLANTDTEQKAVFNKNQTLEIHLASHKNLGMSSIYHHDTESGTSEQVSTVRLDDYLAGHPVAKIDMIKIDIEGAEMFALQGMKGSLRKFKPEIFIELKEEALQHSGYSVNDIIEFLIRIGYKQYAVSENGHLIQDLDKKRKDYYNFLFVFK